MEIQGVLEEWINIGVGVAILVSMTEHLMGSIYFSEGIERVALFL